MPRTPLRASFLAKTEKIKYRKSPNDQNSSFFQVLQFESPILVFEGLKGTSAKLFALITFPLYTF